MKVLAPVDGSKYAQAVVDALIGMRWPAGTEIMLLTVVGSGDTGLPIIGQGPARMTPAQVQGALETSNQSLATMAAELGAALPDCSVTSQTRAGDAKSEIVAFAEEWQADLTIMGSRGHKGLDLFLLGSVSQGVLNQSPCPVLILKYDPNASSGRDIQQGFKKILITVDNSAYSAAAVNWLAGLSWPDDANFRIMTVIESLAQTYLSEPNTTRASGMLQEHEELARAARAEVLKMAEPISSVFGQARVTIDVCEGEPKDSIIKAATAFGADLIVMGSHGRTGVPKLLLGSVSQAVSVHATCAVAVVRGLVARGESSFQQTGMFKRPQR